LAAMDPESKLLLAIAVGDRTLATAQRLVHQVVPVLAPGCVPLLLTDGFKEDTTALLTHFGQWVQPPRRAGCPCPRCSMPRGSRPCATAWCLVPWKPSNRCWRRAVGRSTRRLSSASPCRCASMGLLLDGASPRSANTR